jgi:branched-chain amino acid transport system substrate-binding protein
MDAFRVKAPRESKGRWDDYAVVARIPGNEAFGSLDQGGCRLVGSK